MIRNTVLTVLVLLVAVQVASSQIAVEIGPKTAPVGCDILISVSNDTPTTFFIGSIGPIQVFNSAGNEIFNYLALPLIAIPVSPGEAIVHFRWNQLDNSGAQVAPGNYSMQVDVNGTLTTQSLTIGGVDAAMTSIGALRPGVVRSLYLCSPQDAGRIYGYAASATSNVGIPTCAGSFPLDNDFLLTLSTTPGNGIFFNTVGVLSGPADPFPGTSTAPAIIVPNNPLLSGFSFEVAFFVVDVSSPCPIARISDAATLTIL